MKDEKNIAEIDRIDMAFEAGMRQMRLNSFHLQSRDIDLSLSGTLSPEDGWPVEVSGVWRYRGNEFPQMEGTCRVSDSLANGILEIESTMPFSLQLNSFFQIDDGLSFQAGLQLDRFNPGLFFESYPGLIDGAAAIDGQMVGALFRADIKIETVTGQIRSIPFSFSGNASFSEGDLTLAEAILRSGESLLQVDGAIGSKYALQYSLDIGDLAEFDASVGGALTVEGKVTGETQNPKVTAVVSGENLSGEGFSLASLYGDVEGEPFSSGEFNVKIQLQEAAFQNQFVQSFNLEVQGSLAEHHLQIETQSGPFEAEVGASGSWETDEWTGIVDMLTIAHPLQGRLKLTEQVGLILGREKNRIETACFSHVSGKICLEGEFIGGAWQAGATLQDFNPGIFLEKWPGTITAELSGRGDFAEPQARHELTISSLAGFVRDLPLAGGGSLELKGDTLLAEDLRLQYGNAQLRANGILQNEYSDFRFSGEIEELRTFLPEMTGRFSFAGEIQGSREEPMAHLSFNAAAGKMDSFSFAEVVGDLAVDIQPEGEIRAKVKGENIAYNDLLVSDVTFAASGTTMEHSFSLAAVTSFGSGELQGISTYDSSWKASLHTMNLFLQKYGDYTLQKPAQLEIGPAKSAVENFCMQGAMLSVCLSGAYNEKKAWQVESRIDTLSLALLEDAGLLDTPVAGELQGRIRAGGRAERIENMEGWISLPEILLYGNDEEASRYSFSDTRVDVSMAEGALVLNWASVPQKSGSFSGELSIQRFDEIADNSAALPLEGYLDFYLDDLSFVTILSDALLKPSGTFTGRLNVGGTTAAPTVNGDLALEEGNIHLTELGVKLEDVSAAVTSRQDLIEYVITARSGPGRVRGEGDVRRAESSSWELTSHLTGTDFELFGTEKYQIRTSPDVHVFLGEKGNTITGRLDIPFARIVLADESSRVTSSADVVIVDAEQQPQPKGHFVIDLDIALGDDVTIDAYGLKSGLTGAFELQDSPAKNMSASGELVVRDGEYTFYSVELEISRGRLLFSGGSIDNPGVDFRLQRKVEKVMVGVDVSGTVNDLEFELFSNPVMDESNIMAYLLVGRSMYASSDNDQSLISAAASALGMRGANTITNALGEYIPIDEIYLDGGTGTEDMSIVLGKNITEDLFIGYDHNFFDSSGRFKVRYNLGGNFSVETRSGVSSTSGDIIYSIER
ncbi:MAG: translocation/assembly module TamB domain-containing protein [Desulfopila sp.]|jgi:autotransporter translocation and assembly factor TamB|nr:translocation/assembly module TamB domain-containing protein [Desulfopila sp.]